MHICCIEGFLGVGKTLGMSALATHFATRSNATLYSNYGLKNSHHFSDYTQFLDLTKNDSSIICLDEAHNDLDARNFSQNSVKFFTHLIYYLRKLRTTIFFTSPQFLNLDSRVRSITNLYIHVAKDQKYFRYYLYDYQSLRYLKTLKIEKQKIFNKNLYDTNAIVTPMNFPSSKEEHHKFIHKLKEASESHSQVLHTNVS